MPLHADIRTAPENPFDRAPTRRDHAGLAFLACFPCCGRPRFALGVNPMNAKAPWITYRPELKVLDCTIRDGGLINEHMFEDKLVKAIYQTCVDAGVDYMEIGYKSSKRLFAKD